QVEARQPARLADYSRRPGRDAPVQRGPDQRQLEPVGTQGPGDVDVIRIARAPRGHDRDLVEPVRPPGLLAASDLYFHCGIVSVGADVSGASVIGPSIVAAGYGASGRSISPNCGVF